MRSAGACRTNAPSSVSIRKESEMNSATTSQSSLSILLADWTSIEVDLPCHRTLSFLRAAIADRPARRHEQSLVYTSSKRSSFLSLKARSLTSRISCRRATTALLESGVVVTLGAVVVKYRVLASIFRESRGEESGRQIWVSLEG